MPAPKIRQYAGDIRMWRLATDGTRTPVIPSAADVDGNQPIETNACSFSYAEGDKTSIKSKRRGALYNQPIYSDTQPGTTSISITLLEVPAPILARVLYGEAADASITAGSVTDADFVVAVKDAPLRLPHRCVKSTPAPVVKKGATTLVAGTDYVIDYRRGTLLVKAATVAKGDTLKLSYSYESVDATRILGGATPTESFYITGDMEDRNSGEQGLLEVFEAKLTVDGDVDWLSAEPLSPVLKGELLVPNGAPAPYTFDVYKQVA